MLTVFESLYSIHGLRIALRNVEIGIRAASTFRSADLVIKETKYKKSKPNGPLKFGHFYTDHMMSASWTSESGWSHPTIDELKAFPIHPGAKTLHYACAVFEGMKAMVTKDGSLCIFRPDLHSMRLLESAKRAALPEFNPQEFVKCLKALLRLDRSWAPKEFGTSLYIRPLIFGDEPVLGLDESASAKFMIMISPVGGYTYFKSGGVSLYAGSEYVRAWPGGAGTVKISANYGPTIYPQKVYKLQGYDSVLWLFGPDELITEVGTMNIFVYWTDENGEKQICTPKLNGLILPGVTRSSLIELMSSWKELPVIERDITMKQVIKALKENRLHSMFGSGTACAVTPVGEIVYKGQRYTIPIDESDHSMSKRCYKALTDIQYGIIKGHPWMSSVDE